MEAIRLYAPGINVSDWRISPLDGDLSVLPRTLLLTGTRDLLTPDNLIFAEKARAQGVDVQLLVEPSMFHVCCGTARIRATSLSRRPKKLAF
jgi:acetyl esterase/lipase